MNWSADILSAATKNPLPLGMGSVKLDKAPTVGTSYTVTIVSDNYQDISATVTAEKAKKEEPEKTYTQVQKFVIRLYENVLGREADEAGLNAWDEVLTSGKESGAKVSMGFIDSTEFKSRKLSDSEYLDVLYRTFLNREADPQGKADWTKLSCLRAVFQETVSSKVL